ncbi:MAG: hypothetical protein IT209_07440, partial [Armatimonadetes bacterium]|nr:hypothetical protein [Armatimonadota bacterium]
MDLLFLGSPEKVAQKVGVRHSTLQRWLEDRRFQQALKARAKQKRRA